MSRRPPGFLIEKDCTLMELALLKPPPSRPNELAKIKSSCQGGVKSEKLELHPAFAMWEVTLTVT